MRARLAGTEGLSRGQRASLTARIAALEAAARPGLRAQQQGKRTAARRRTRQAHLASGCGDRRASGQRRGAVRQGQDSPAGQDQGCPAAERPSRRSRRTTKKAEPIPTVSPGPQDTTSPQPQNGPRRRSRPGTVSARPAGHEGARLEATRTTGPQNTREGRLVAEHRTAPPGGAEQPAPATAGRRATAAHSGAGVYAGRARAACAGSIGPMTAMGILRGPGPAGPDLRRRPAPAGRDRRHPVRGRHHAPG